VSEVNLTSMMQIDNLYKGKAAFRCDLHWITGLDVLMKMGDRHPLANRYALFFPSERRGLICLMGPSQNRRSGSILFSSWPI
jgi:hypothetical protein